MSKAGDEIRAFLIEHMEDHPSDIVRVTAEQFGCTRQAVHKHMRWLIAQGVIAVAGSTRNKRYWLETLEEKNTRLLLPGLTEDSVWRTEISPLLKDFPENAVAIWQYGFTEMLNNVIDHSGAEHVTISVSKTAASTAVRIYDNGIGIFRKIQKALGLMDERHAVLELAKGKFTTDPARHSGEGIFFASRMFDSFEILSGEVYFSHEFDLKEDWILQGREPKQGTMVSMALRNNTRRTTKEIFDEFTSGQEYGFTRTVVPVKLMQYGDDNLVSRSQAKRLLARFDRFQLVILDFSGVASIGQAFADEVFRVFPSMYPDVRIVPANTKPPVMQMITRATSHS